MLFYEIFNFILIVLYALVLVIFITKIVNQIFFRIKRTYPVKNTTIIELLEIYQTFKIFRLVKIVEPKLLVLFDGYDKVSLILSEKTLFLYGKQLILNSDDLELYQSWFLQEFNKIIKES